MNRVLMLRSLVPQARSNFSTSVRSQIQNKVKEGQTKFQTDNGVPIHLKGGGLDTFTYATIMGLTVVGTTTDWQKEAVKAGRNVDPRVRIAYNAAMSIAGVCFAFLGYAFYLAAGKAEEARKT